MKYLVSLGIVGVFLWTAANAIAQNTKSAPIKIPRVTPTPAKAKTLKVTPTPFSKIPLGKRIGERFTLRIWAVVRSPSMPGVWTKSAYFGNLKLNDQLRWSIPQSQATNHQLGVGETLAISEDMANRQGGPFNFSALYPQRLGNTNRPKVDLRFVLSSVSEGKVRREALYFDAIDLFRESGKTYTCRQGGGALALYVQVERTGYVYLPIIQRPVPTPTPRFRRPPHIP